MAVVLYAQGVCSSGGGGMVEGVKHVCMEYHVWWRRQGMGEMVG